MIKANEFLNQYGDMEVTFNYYYKYSFEFIGIYGDTKIRVIVGGSSDEIYRFELAAEKAYKVKELPIASAEVIQGTNVMAEYSAGGAIY